MCALVTRVPLDQFLNIRSLGGEPSPVLAAKADGYRKLHTCFGGAIVTHNHPSACSPKPNPPVAERALRTEVIKIGSRELSRENLARKDFIALMNKLTEQNKGSILQSVRNVYREDCVAIYVGILWDMIQRQPDSTPLYLDTLKVLCQCSTSSHIWHDTWKHVWDEFRTNRHWQPSPSILGQEGDYNEFCDFVKWKKRALAALRAWPLFAKHNWIPADELNELVKEVVNACDKELHTSETGSKLADTYLEEVITLLHAHEHPACWKDIIWPWACTWNARTSSVRPSTRFKLLDISDACEAKMKTVQSKNNVKRR
jgi:hypothetical protein